jgi:NAD(P)H dehydrogenase (quinone)
VHALIVHAHRVDAVVAGVRAEQNKIARADLLIPFVAHMPGKISAEDRQRALADYADRLRSLDSVPRLYFHPAEDYGPDERLRPGVKARSGFQHN